MSIRWKLLFLLLAIAITPLVMVTYLANQATTRLGTTLGDQARTALTKVTRQHLEQLVADKARLIARKANLVNLAVQVQAREVERCLAVESPEPRDIFMAEDFDGERPPEDLELSNRHLRAIGPGELMAIPVSAQHPVFKLAPGQIDGPVHLDLLRLDMVVPLYQQLQQDYSDVFYWHFTSLENGVHSSYPGHGGFPIDYDGRQRR